MVRLLFTGEDKEVPLENIYRKSTCFFIGGGPSLNNLELGYLLNRGILTFAVNNIAARNVRPNIWCSTDDPKSFHSNIWKDPGILKLVRCENYRKTYLNGKVYESPNTFYFNSNTNFQPDVYLTQPTVCFGNESKAVDKFGVKGHRNVMYCAIRLMYYLGIRRIFLLGCDFNMNEEQPYAFEENKWKGGVATNNEGYDRMAKRFTGLLPIFNKAKLQVFNCNPNSALKVFPYYDYEQAINENIFPEVEPGKLKDMYGQNPISINKETIRV